jgi:hypothetical protein
MGYDVGTGRRVRLGYRSVGVACFGAAAIASGCSQGTTGPKLKIYAPMTLAFDHQHVSQGDTLTWTLDLPSPAAAVAGDQLVLTFSGDGSAVDSVTIPDNAYLFNFGLVVPAGLPDGTLVLTATIPAAGQVATASVKIEDTAPPMFDSAAVRGAAAPTYNGVAFTGQLFLGAGLADTLQLWASDNHALAWVGWALGAPVNVRDSEAVQGSTAEADFPLALPLSAVGSGATMTVFTRDQDGHQHIDTIAPMDIVTFNQHPVHAAPVLDTIPDLAIDTKRGVVYLAQPDSGRLAVLSLATMTYQTPIPFMGRPISVDLTPSGDSLLVVLDGSNSLAVVQLAGSPQLAGAISVPLYPSSVVATVPYRVRVASDGHPVVTMRTSGPINGGGDYIAYPMVIATDSIVPNRASEIGAYPISPAPSARSGDANVVVVIGGGGIVYNALAQSFAGAGGAWSAYKPFSVSVSNGPTYTVLSGHAVSNAPLGADTLYGATIAPDGTNAYVGEASCATGDAACVDTASGSLVQYSLGLWYLYNNLMFPEAGHATNLSSLPHVAESLVVSPDGRTLIAIGGKTLMAVDLTTSIAPSATSVGHLRRLVARGQRRRLMASAVKSHAPAPAGNSPLSDLHSMLRVHVMRR